MRMLLKLGTGMLARFLGMLAEHLAQWLFHQVSEGAGDACSVTQLQQFARWFLKMLAGQLCGRSRHHLDQYEDDLQPGFYGAR
jgi:hypothetical protein